MIKALKREEAPERRCIVTGETRSKSELIRFVAGPDGEVVPDLAGRLPGRGLWVSVSREALEKAVKRGLFAKAARMRLEVTPDLADRVEDLLARRAGEALGLAKKAGALVAGFEKVMATITDGDAACLIEARDGAEDGRRKLEQRARMAVEAGIYDDVPVFAPLWAHEMSLALGRANVIHAALFQGPMVDRVRQDLARLEMFGRKNRPDEAVPDTGSDGARGY
ncbi:hypothetical protein FHS78_002470 [Parvibaculum indicum]|uniref:RNA-binding protein n=1 Tax=Parvibaculum indicum TaxID=562969 RepID=UPI00141E35F3|nr:hypothetical protein [Parvibaculum indicum]